MNIFLLKDRVIRFKLTFNSNNIVDQRIGFKLEFVVALSLNSIQLAHKLLRQKTVQQSFSQELTEFNLALNQPTYVTGSCKFLSQSLNSYCYHPNKTKQLFCHPIAPQFDKIKLLIPSWNILLRNNHKIYCQEGTNRQTEHSYETGANKKTIS